MLSEKFAQNNRDGYFEITEKAVLNSLSVLFYESPRYTRQKSNYRLLLQMNMKPEAEIITNRATSTRCHFQQLDDVREPQKMMQSRESPLVLWLQDHKGRRRIRAGVVCWVMCAHSCPIRGNTMACVGNITTIHDVWWPIVYGDRVQGRLKRHLAGVFQTVRKIRKPRLPLRTEAWP